MFIENACLGKNAVWRYIVTLIFVFAAHIVGVIPLLVVFYAKGAPVSGDLIYHFSEWGLDPNAGLALIVLPFLTAFLTLLWAVKALHKRNPISLISTERKINWRKFLFGAAVWALITVIVSFLSELISPMNGTWSFNLNLFIPLLLTSLCMIPFQASFEEVLMRGYLMQGFGILFKYRIITLLFTSTIFGLLHLDTPEVNKFGLALLLPNYIGIGIMLGIIVLMDEGVEISMGIHSANNILAATLITHADSTFQTEALFKANNITFENILTGNILFFFSAFAALVILSRKYGWNTWSKLLGKIKPREKPMEEKSVQEVSVAIPSIDFPAQQ